MVVGQDVAVLGIDHDAAAQPALKKFPRLRLRALAGGLRRARGVLFIAEEVPEKLVRVRHVLRFDLLGDADFDNGRPKHFGDLHEQWRQSIALRQSRQLLPRALVLALGDCVGEASRKMGPIDQGVRDYGYKDSDWQPTLNRFHLVIPFFCLLTTL
jgi:hypothetical protein